jgi:lipopolysaccharide transport system ATP-binding protein
MSSNAVRVSGLGKQYRLGEIRSAFTYGSLRESLANAANGAMRRLRGAGADSSDRSPAHVWALRDVSFSAAPGEIVGIIGRNGAGKSTLLKILSRITRPTEGEAELRGRLGSLLEVGTGFHPELTGRDNIYLNGAILGMRRADIDRRFDAIVAFSEIGRFLDTPVKRYSSGMYVRLAFSVAAHLEPDILVVDEVLAVGDAEFQKKCIGRMQTVVGEGRTVLFVSHNMAAVKSLCTRAIFIQDGHIAADGDVDAIVDRYLGTRRSQHDHGWVPDDVRRSGTGEGRIRQVQLLDNDGDAITQIYLGQRFRVEIAVEMTSPMRNIFGGVGVSALDGTPIAFSHSNERGQANWNLEPGWHRIVVDVDITLLPRAYTLDVFIMRQDGRQLDYIEQVLEFTGLSVAENGSDVYPWRSTRGFVRPETRWQTPRAIEAESVAAARTVEKG